jgi:small-conductance mechanosensitive channel
MLDTFREFLLEHEFYFSNIVVFFIVLACSAGFSYVSLYLFQKWLAAKQLLPKDFKFKRYFRASVQFLYFSIFLHIASPFIEFSEKSTKTFLHIIEILTILSATYFVIRAADFTQRMIFYRLEISEENGTIKHRKMRTQFQFMFKMGVTFISFLGLAAILMSFEGARKIGTSLIASAGLASVVIGLAAQKSLGNIIAGFQIAFTQPLRLDDIVMVENEWGQVEEISLSYVVVKLWDLRRIVLPITYFIEKPFQNWSRHSTKLLGPVNFSLDYRVNIQEVRDHAEKILLETELWDRRVCTVQVVGSNDRVIDVRIAVSSDNAQHLFELQCFMREKMLSFIQSKEQYLPRTRSQPVT